MHARVWRAETALSHPRQSSENKGKGIIALVTVGRQEIDAWEGTIFFLTANAIDI